MHDIYCHTSSDILINIKDIFVMERDTELEEEGQIEFSNNLFSYKNSDQILEKEESHSFNSLDNRLLNFRIKPTYPSLLSKKEYNARKTTLSFSTSNRAVKRVDAPYINIDQIDSKYEKLREEKKEECKQFQHYLKKKPYILMRDLQAFLCNSEDLTDILFETIEVLKSTIFATGASLYIVKKASGEICKCPRFSRANHQRWKIESGTTVAAHVAHIKQYVVVDELSKDTRFPDGIGTKDQSVNSVVCVPMVNPKNTCYAVVELYRDKTQPNFEKNDLKMITVVISWTSAAIHQNAERLILQKQQESSSYLLNAIKCYFGDTVTAEKLISDIMGHCKETLKAERGSLYILNKQQKNLEAEVYEEGVDEESSILHKKNLNSKLNPKSILGIVASTGSSINVIDTSEDPRYDEEADLRMGLVTKNLLCVPIKGVDGILGLVQVTNKKEVECFTSNDEHLLQTLSLYWALALHYFNLNKSSFKAAKLSECYTSIFKFHLAPCIHEIKYFSTQPVEQLPKDFDEFGWYITPELSFRMPQYIMGMMIKILGVHEIEIRGMIEFILSTQKGYRKNPYHSFEHAFVVCHSMYNILKRNYDSFTATERKALLIAALCHDIDHRGITNNFLELTNDLLAQLYPNSSLENHHYQVTLLLLQKLKIFRSVNSATFKELLSEIKFLILSTDLSTYFRCRTVLIQVKQSTGFEWWNTSHRRLIKDLMITLCDLSGQCKPFTYAKQLTDCLYKEFYKEGDMEKAIGVVPLPMLDREKQDLVPEDQVNFLTLVIIPCAELLQSLMPNTESLLLEAMRTRAMWREIIQVQGQRTWRQSELPKNH